MIERQLLWYMYSENIPERHYWNFLVVNGIGKIEPLKQKLYEQLNPVVEGTNVSLKPVVSETLIDRGRIKDSTTLVYELFCLETLVSHIDFSKVYRGKVKKDRRLCPRKTKDGWNYFIDKVSQGEI
jgi:hypothetical protein